MTRVDLAFYCLNRSARAGRHPNATEHELFILCRLSRVGIAAGKFNRQSLEASRNDPL